MGCALGDAVGAWAERKPAEEARKFVDLHVSKVHFDETLNGHHHGVRFGQITDDTQLTLRLMESLTQLKGWDPKDYADRIADAFAQDRIVGYGGATREAAVRLLDGASWEDSGTPPPRAGNGAAMRATPIGLFFWNDVDRIVECSREQAVITHKAPMSVAGAVAIAIATAMCLNASKETSNPSERGWWAWLERFVAQEDENFAADIGKMSDIVFKLRKSRGGRPVPDEHRTVLSWVLEDDDDNWDGVSPWARSSVLWALYCLMRHPRDPWLAIGLAIWGGGDTDSTAAMAGAMSGALVGVSGFPKEVLEKAVPLIHDVKNDPCESKGLEQAADNLHAVVSALYEEGTQTQP